MNRMRARIAVAGAGLVGRRHAELVAEHAVLAGIADPAPAGREVARELDTPCSSSLEELLSHGGVEGVIVATPNQRHEADALTCIGAGIPVLVEKPISTDFASGGRMLAAAAEAGVPLLVGHHRRYNPIIEAAHDSIHQGDLGRITAVNALCWLHKPAPYFDTEWRRKPGAGPVLINLIHDIELLIHLCGPVSRVQAAESNAARGNEVEDTAAALLTFVNGALGTVSVSDAAAAPWSWELTAAENPAYPQTGQSSYVIAGTKGSLSIPDLTRWSYKGDPDWMTPILNQRLTVGPADPLVRQIQHFADVIVNGASPRVTGLDGLRALSVIEAIKQSAATGQPVEVPQHLSSNPSAD